MNSTAQEVKTRRSMHTPANAPSGPTLAEEFEAALEWWRGAGVDHDFSDDVTDWLAPAEQEPSATGDHPGPKPRKPLAPPPPPPKKIGGDPAQWPDTLDAFHKWWTQNPAIDDGGTYPTVAPRGTAGARLMVLVAEPEEQDSARLLSGPQGSLLGNILRAFGLAPEDVYFASVLRRHTPIPDWEALRGAGLAELTIHHVGLANPQRILAFGRNIPPLLGNDTAQGAAILHNFNHEGGSIPVMGVGSLAELLRSAPRRQRFWRNWLKWTDG